MQDKNIDNWNNEELENLAWSKMQQLLDQEMPQERKRRRFAAWWVFGVAAASVVLGAGVAFWVINNQLTNTNQFVSNSNITKTSEQHTIANNATSEVATTTMSQAMASMPMEISANMDDSKMTQQQSAGYFNNNDSNSNSNNIVTSNNVAVSSILNDNNIAITTNVIDNNIENNAIVTAHQNVTLASLMTLEAGLLDIVTKKPILDIATKSALLKSVNPKPFHWVASAAVQTSGFDNIGYAASMGVEKQLSKRWTIGTGLEYNQFDIDTKRNKLFTRASGLEVYDAYYVADEIADTVINVNSITQNVDGTFNYLDPSGSVSNSEMTLPPLTTSGLDHSPATPSVHYVNTNGDILLARDTFGNYFLPAQKTTLHYISMPISAQYKLSQHWGLNVSARPSVLLGANLPKSTTSLTDTSSEKKSQIFTRNPIGLRRFDMGVGAGLDYHIDSHWRVGAQCYQGLVDYTQYQEKQWLTHRVYRVSVAYRW